MKFIAIDIGSTSIKSALLDLDTLEIRNKLKEPTPGRNLAVSSNRYEVSLDALYEIVLKMINYHVQAEPLIQGILLSTQMHGFVLSTYNNEAITPYISWQDERCIEALPGSSGNALEHLHTLLGDDYYQHSGIHLKPRLALSNLYRWLLDNPHVIKQDIKFHTLGSYLISKMTGEYVCHLTNAAATGFVDIRQGDWHAGTISLLGCSDMQFPKIIKETDVAGYFSGSNGLIPVYPDIGDHQASLLGSMLMANQDVMVSIGTAGLISRIIPTMDGGLHEVRPYFDGCYVQTITGIPGGRNLDKLTGLVSEIGQEIFGQALDNDVIIEKINGLIADKRDTDLQMEIGFFNNQVGVKQGMITHITAENLQLPSIFLAAYRNMAQVYKNLIHTLVSNGEENTRYIMSGGVAWHNRILFEIMTSKLDGKGLLSPYSDEPLVGLMRIALVCSKQYQQLDQTRELLVRKLN
jgi:sugar (pentulose or hexulose) kinase